MSTRHDKMRMVVIKREKAYNASKWPDIHLRAVARRPKPYREEILGARHAFEKAAIGDRKIWAVMNACNENEPKPALMSCGTRQAT